MRNEVAGGSQARTFTIDGVVLNKVDNFECLVCQISSRDFDAPGLFVIRDSSHLRLRLTRFLINRSNSIMSFDVSLIDSIYTHTYSVIIDYTIFAFPSGSCR